MIADKQQDLKLDNATLINYGINALYVLGVFGIIQWWTGALYIIGLLAFVLAFVVDNFVQLNDGVPLSTVAERAAGTLVIFGAAGIVQWWRPGLYDASVFILLASLVVYPLTMLWNNGELPVVLERLATILMALGFYGLFQWWQPMDLYWIGRGLLAIGFVVYIAGMILSGAEPGKILEQASLILLLVGGYAVFQWRRMDDYEIGLWFLRIGFLGYVVGIFLNRAGIVATLERALILLMIFGMLGMFQSWNIKNYEQGFYLLGLATLGFIVVSHIPQRANQPE